MYKICCGIKRTTRIWEDLHFFKKCSVQTFSVEYGRSVHVLVFCRYIEKPNDLLSQLRCRNKFYKGCIQGGKKITILIFRNSFLNQLLWAMKLTRKKWKIRTEVIKTHVIEYIMGVSLNVANISVWVTDYLFNNNNICRQFIFDIFLILFICSKSNKLKLWLNLWDFPRDFRFW